MKTTRKLAKILALVLCVATLTLAFASCGKDKNVAVSYTADGKTYTLSEAEYSLLMTVVKQNLFSQLTYGGYYYGSKFGIVDNAAFWAQKTADGQTYEQTQTANVLALAKSVVVEKYLAEKYGLINADGTLNFGEDTELKKEYEEAIASVANAVKTLGGKGAYKRYYGYLPEDMEKYYKFNYTSQLVKNYLYTVEHPLTDDQLNEYYTENFKQYIIILINKEQDIKYEKDSDGNYVTDANGNKKPYYVVYDESGSTKYVTDISEEYLKEKKYTLAYSYQYENITDDARKTAKKELVDTILAELKKEDGPSFEELAAKYSDEMLTHYYKDGYMVDGDLIDDDKAREAIKDLKVGEYTTTSFTVDTKYEYIVKRVELTEKAYKQAEEGAEDKTYAALFENYEDAVIVEKYSHELEEMSKGATSVAAVTGKYTMQKTFLSKMFVEQ
ncbi:MAG: hypothetical protein IJX27_07560 [Clostridia bacterium]|nr:hypothetical protein [Clostridia bacterium]